VHCLCRLLMIWLLLLMLRCAEEIVGKSRALGRTEGGQKFIRYRSNFGLSFGWHEASMSIDVCVHTHMLELVERKALKVITSFLGGVWGIFSRWDIFRPNRASNRALLNKHSLHLLAPIDEG
jgi:hypothetical protein